MKNKGYTLIEVLVVLIMLIIMTLVMVSVIGGIFNSAANRAQIEIREQHKPDQQVQEAPIEQPKGEEKRL